MSESNPLSRLEFTKRVAKRAQYEAFEFTLTSEGVHIRNGSHADPSEHEYLVTVHDRLPTACTCPADARFEGACKHRVAIAIRRPILEAASTHIATDGGTSVDEDHAGEVTDIQSENPEECTECLDDFPCWECVRTGRKAIPE